jgi:SOS-response transcriptional repressor LexA
MEVAAFRVACGEFIAMGDVGKQELERPGRALVPERCPYKEGMFTARARGSSMLPKIPDGAWCLFHPDVVGTREDRTVLAEDQSDAGAERSTLKKFHSVKAYLADGTWEHEEIFLLPLNSEHAPIRLERDRQYHILGWFVGQVPQIERVDPPQYPSVTDED